MKAKTIEALDSLIAALENLKEALEGEASKSGDSADDESSGKVSGSKRKAGAAAVPSKGKGKAGKKGGARDDDDDDSDGSDDEDDEDSDSSGAGDDDDDDDESTPPPKGVKAGKAAKGKPAKEEKPAKGKKAKASKADDDDDAITQEKVRALATSIIQKSEDGKKIVLGVLGKYKAKRIADLEESDYEAVHGKLTKELAKLSDEDDDEDDDDGV